MNALDGLRRGAQMALAALLACAGGAVILALLVTLARLAGRIAAGQAGGPFDAVLDIMPALAVTILAGGLAIGPALSTGWLPAFAAGALLGRLGRRWAWARRRPAWSAAGAAVALISYLQVPPPGRPAGSLLDLFGLPDRALPFLFLAAGAAAGQVYRSALTATAPFFELDEGPDEH
jgi:hypothetical protein